MGAHHMTREQKQMARRLKAKGLTLKAIARDLSCSVPSGDGQRLCPARSESGRPDHWTPAPGRLSAEEREEILLGLARGESMSAIARSLGRAPSTITREVAANGGVRRLWGLEGPLPGRDIVTATQARQAGPPAAGAPGEHLARGAVVARGDRRALAPGVPRRSDDAGEPRDHLPVPLRPRPR